MFRIVYHANVDPEQKKESWTEAYTNHMGISPTRQGQNNNATQDFLYFNFYLITFEVFYIYYCTF